MFFKVATDPSNPICNYNFNLEVFDGELSDSENVSVIVDYTNCSAETTVTCNPLPPEKPNRIYITNDPETVFVNAEVQLHLWGVYGEGTECELTREPAAVWSITNNDDKKIVSIGTKTGIVTGKEVGTATVEAKYRADGAGDSSVTSTVQVVK